MSCPYESFCFHIGICKGDETVQWVRGGRSVKLQLPSVTFYLTGRKTNMDFKKSERMAEIIFLLYFHLLISKVKGRRKWLPLAKGSWERLEDMEAWIYGLQTELEWRVIWSESESWSLLEKSISRKKKQHFFEILKILSPFWFS